MPMHACTVTHRSWPCKTILHPLILLSLCITRTSLSMSPEEVLEELQKARRDLAAAQEMQQQVAAQITLAHVYIQEKYKAVDAQASLRAKDLKSLFDQMGESAAGPAPVLKYHKIRMPDFPELRIMPRKSEGKDAKHSHKKQKREE